MTTGVYEVPEEHREFVDGIRTVTRRSPVTERGARDRLSQAASELVALGP